ncbi:MAG: dTDP-4-dehydrorhamnose reductase [Magnetospirillum sp.]|nr:dTDP-4-dehydrorhamnose reductase [Magnetospirillum sp.]
MIRVLLLGRSGQLGRALEQELSGRVELVALGRSDLDLTDTAILRARIRAERPHLVINAAAWTRVDAAESDRAGCAEVNAVAPGLIAAEAERGGAALIHYSTDYVFDGSLRRRWRETDRPSPLNAYGAAKLAGEAAIAAACPAHLIVRLSWLYDGQGTNFLRTMLRLMAERPYLRVVDDQVGAPTSAEFVAGATAAIIAQARDRPAAFFTERGGLLHCSCRGRTSWHGFAEAILAEVRRRGWPLTTQGIEAISTAEYPLPARRPANSLLALSRLRQVHGIHPPHWRTALRAVLDRMDAPPKP